MQCENRFFRASWEIVNKLMLKVPEWVTLAEVFMRWEPYIDCPNDKLMKIQRQVMESEMSIEGNITVLCGQPLTRVDGRPFEPCSRWEHRDTEGGWHIVGASS